MDIGDASQGTFNSYSLILLVLHFLQVGASPPVLPCLQLEFPHFFNTNMILSEMKLFSDLPGPLQPMEENKKTVAELLIAFFDYYCRFDFENNAISIRRGCVFPRTHLASNTERYRVFIEEPFEGLNTARCVRNAEHWDRIQDAFWKARDQLHCGSGPPTLKHLKIKSSHY